MEKSKIEKVAFVDFIVTLTEFYSEFDLAFVLWLPLVCLVKKTTNSLIFL